MTASQYYEKVRGHSLTPKLEEALEFLQTALQVMPDRKMFLGKEEEQPLVMYTDASTRKGGLRLGILLMERGRKPICSVHDVPTWVTKKWELKSTYIGQGELLAGPLAMHLYKDRLQGRDVTWYVDNKSALSALIKHQQPHRRQFADGVGVGLAGIREPNTPLVRVGAH